MAMNPEQFEGGLNGEAQSKIQEVKVKSNAFTGIKVKNLDLPAGTMVLTINRKGLIIVPDEETPVQLNDILTLMGRPADIEKASLVLQKNRNGT